MEVEPTGTVHIGEPGALSPAVVYVDEAVEHATSGFSVHTIPLRQPGVESIVGIETGAKHELLADGQSGRSAIDVHR